jgi:hypothetical protein
MRYSSAHIFDPTDKRQDQGKRLGLILNADPRINLMVENFYPEGTEAHVLVQKDIDAFKQHHQARREERHEAKGLSLASSSRESLSHSTPVHFRMKKS